MVRRELTRSQNIRYLALKRLLQRLCSPLGIGLLLIGVVLFPLVGHHMVRQVFEYVYTPPALSREKYVVYDRFIRLVEAYPEYRRVHLGMRGGRWAKIHDSVTEQVGFSRDEEDELDEISKVFRQVGCVRAEKYSSYVVFMHRLNYILPTSPGVLYSLDGRNPNDLDDEFLNSKKPFMFIKDHWYMSRWLVAFPSRGFYTKRLPSKSIIDRSLRVPSSLSLENK